jgi:hypothetical protein
VSAIKLPIVGVMAEFRPLTFPEVDPGARVVEVIVKPAPITYRPGLPALIAPDEQDPAAKA